MSLTPYFGGTSALDPFNNDWSLWPTTFNSSSVGSQSLSRLRNEAVQPLAPLMSVDFIESENDYNIHVDIPGVENLDINTDNQTLTIEADRKVAHEEDTDIAHTRERSYGKVRRRIRIPGNGDVVQATAKYKNGVLTVSIPKKPDEAGGKRKINIG